ncbi:PREDICTED: nucleolar protein 10 [Theobroma cacao]|uniref:Nucleolar protein 10 n=1 Tax=Theobroma cacao TaxID=3641 RepID=A0AB32WG20_THECC|nr:PREDICTED: nucleolar protein 10 [Theobroma cacao]
MKKLKMKRKTMMDYEIDEQSQEFLALHPMASKKQPSLVVEHFEPVMDNKDQITSDSDVSEASQSSDDFPVNHKSKRKKSQGPRMYEVKDKRHAEAFWNNVSLAKEDSLPMGERVKALQGDQRVSGLPSGVKLGSGGSRQISFISRSSAKNKEDEEKLTRREKRGVQLLGLKPDRSMFGGRGRGRGRGRRGRR